MTERYDGDSEDSRAAFRDYDQRELARTKTTWQIWRDACAWQAARCNDTEPVAPVGDARAAVIEECAKVCDALARENDALIETKGAMFGKFAKHNRRAATAIRALAAVAAQGE